MRRGPSVVVSALVPAAASSEGHVPGQVEQGADISAQPHPAGQGPRSDHL